MPNGRHYDASPQEEARQREGSDRSTSSWDDVRDLLEETQENERARIDRQLERIDEQLEQREEIREANIETLEEELDEARQDLRAFSTRSFYDEETAQREHRRLEQRVADLQEAIRRERRQHWQNHQDLRRERRELVRERQEVEDDAVVETYLDRV